MLLIILLFIVLLITLYFIFIGKLKKTVPELMTFDKPVQFVGLAINTSNQDIYKDVAKVASAFIKIKKAHPIPYTKDPWAFVAVSLDYNKETTKFTYIVGDVVSKTGKIPEGLKAYEIPALTYAVFPIRPKSKFAWGITMGRMKRYIYTEWLPQSGYEPADSIGDFELHDHRSLGKHPEINLYVALKDKQIKAV